MVAGSTYTMVFRVTPVPATGPIHGVGLTVSASGGTKALWEGNGKHHYDLPKDLISYKDYVISVAVPASFTGGKVTIVVDMEAEGLVADPQPGTLSITVKKKPKPTPTHSAPSGGGTSSGSGGVTQPAPINNLPTGAGTTTPGTNGSAVLPSIAPEQTPTTAPDPAAPVSQTDEAPSMRSTAEKSDQLSFGELASTQAAWLAALLVAFFLLLTQVRLGKANVKDVRPKGSHRQPRKQTRSH